MPGRARRAILPTAPAFELCVCSTSGRVRRRIAPRRTRAARSSAGEIGRSSSSGTWLTRGGSGDIPSGGAGPQSRTSCPRSDRHSARSLTCRPTPPPGAHWSTGRRADAVGAGAYHPHGMNAAGAKDSRIGVLTLGLYLGTCYGGGERVAYDFVKLLDPERFARHLCIVNAPPADPRAANGADMAAREELWV